MKPYSPVLERLLSPDELSELRSECYPALELLGARYAPEIDLRQGFPSGAAYLDLLRTSWLLDNRPDRPAFEILVDALGYAFGLVLKHEFGLQWYLASDVGGTFITMGRQPTDEREKLSIPPFTYVEKRETLQNAEVFADFFSQVPGRVGL